MGDYLPFYSALCIVFFSLLYDIRDNLKTMECCNFHSIWSGSEHNVLSTKYAHLMNKFCHHLVHFLPYFLPFLSIHGTLDIDYS